MHAHATSSTLVSIVGTTLANERNNLVRLDWVRRHARSLWATVALGICMVGATARAADPVDGSDPQCDDLHYRIGLLNLILPFDVSKDVSDEGWVWVQNSNPALPKFREVSGYVVGSHVATIDYPTTHDTHDHNTKLLVDPGQEDILSNGNKIEYPEGNPTTRLLEIEWENGIRPSETSGDGSAPMLRKQAWPSVGDRYWAEGHWIFDCGHTNYGKHPAEIHPARATAVMRPTTYPLTATGATPVPVTLTSLYIHGRGGFVGQVLNCGMHETVLDDVVCPTESTPINDKDFTFYVCLPERPADTAILTWLILPADGNTLSQQLRVEPVPATNICTNSGEQALDTHTMLRVTAPLAGSSAQPQDVYARRLVAGWVFPPSPPLRHLNVQLKSMNLHEDHEVEGFNGELSFFWMGLDADPEPWRRLSDFDRPTADDASIACGTDHINTLQDYDDDQLCGNGELRFTGPRYDFYVRNGAAFTIRTFGYDQDCYDSYFGHHFDFIEVAVACHGGNPFEIFNAGQGDDLGKVDAVFGPDDAPAYGIGSHALELHADNGDYELRIDIDEIELNQEDTADLSVAMQCSFTGEVLLVGKSLLCMVTGENKFGPGLPRGAALDVTTNPTVTLVKPSTFTLRIPNNSGGVSNETATAPCDTPANGALSCKVGTVPAGGTAKTTADIVPAVAGTLVANATVSALSTDGNASDNSAQYTVQAYRPITLVIRPREGGIKNLSTSGVYPVAILTVPGFDATQVNVATLCFGDPDAPTERDCTEAHARAHVSDLDRDRDLDVLLHYEAAQTGIDSSDTTACLIGQLKNGTGIYGCAALAPVK